ncbi:hypothetical protein ACFFLM_11205 [Deinococcus oregonensis]|uniref:Uncharacterized protein n=1 Tax=Deinococcus oregonensis TaxID=1805970 RepID=A0ABV6AYF2_9DEIO
MALDHHSFLIIGGGLAGIAAARYLNDMGVDFLLIDSPRDAESSNLGGFAAFSGAKFSKLPAGKGLASCAGGEQALSVLQDILIKEYSLDQYPLVKTTDLKIESSFKNEHRAYESYLLTPGQILDFLTRIVEPIKERVISSKCISIKNLNNVIVVELEDSRILTANKVIFAAGRSTEGLIDSLGALEQNGKGFDVGFRIEFPSKDSVSKLRQLGADAKFITKNTRTFCLNSPGHIYRYDYDDISIPGGVVADSEEEKANFGVLTRVLNKQALPSIMQAIRENGLGNFTLKYDTLYTTLARIYPLDIAQEQIEFIKKLQTEGLINLPDDADFHIPLIDWYWKTYGLANSHRTSVSNIYVAGDIAGHARGLLQAIISGRLCAEESSR